MIHVIVNVKQVSKRLCDMYYYSDPPDVARLTYISNLGSNTIYWTIGDIYKDQ